MRPIRLALVILAAICSAQDRPDTAHLAKRLEPLRGHKVYELSDATYKPILNELLAWVENRIKAGETGQQMNVELCHAGLLGGIVESVEDYDSNSVGYLWPVGSWAVNGTDDLMAVTVAVVTGGYCNLDETLVLYRRNPLERIAQINAEPRYIHGFTRRAIAIGTAGDPGGRIVASEWVASNCTSNWNGNILRIDAMQGSKLQTILTRGISVFGGDDVSLNVDGQTVSFNYTSGFRDSSSIAREGVARYQVQGGRAIRQPPIAKSFGGFIDEWLDMDDREAARWASAKATLRHREIAARLNKSGLDWEGAADCPGSPPTRAIASGPKAVFLISGTTPETMRMESVLDAIPASCRELDINHDRSPILREPGR